VSFFRIQFVNFLLTVFLVRWSQSGSVYNLDGNKTLRYDNCNLIFLESFKEGYMRAEEIMAKKVEFIESDAFIYEALEKLIDKKIRSLVVRPKDENDVYGVVTVRDIVFKAIGKGLDMGNTKVAEIATKPVVCIDKDMDIGHIVKLMDKFNIARVFVSEEKKIVGVVALFDIIAAFIKKSMGFKTA